jgi:replication initiator protein A
MEESVKPVDTQTPAPPPTADSSVVVETQEKLTRVAQIIRLEKNLAQLGFFTPSTKTIKSVKEKVTTLTTTVDGKKMEARATIVPSAKYGLPITADQDTLLAILKLATDLRQQNGKVENPVSFTSAELLHLQGKSTQGKHYRDLAEQLMRIKHTGIMSEGAVYLAGKKTFGVDAFNVLERVVLLGPGTRQRKYC